MEKTHRQPLCFLSPRRHHVLGQRPLQGPARKVCLWGQGICRQLCRENDGAIARRELEQHITDPAGTRRRVVQFEFERLVLIVNGQPYAVVRLLALWGMDRPRYAQILRRASLRPVFLFALEGGKKALW